jgi:hypothetical protein
LNYKRIWVPFIRKEELINLSCKKRKREKRSKKEKKRKRGKKKIKGI